MRKNRRIFGDDRGETGIETEVIALGKSWLTSSLNFKEKCL